jgi:hypothetical protein
VLGVDLSMAERNRHCSPAGVPMRVSPGGLTSSAGRIGHFPQAAGVRTDGNAVSLAPLRPFLQFTRWWPTGFAQDRLLGRTAIC